jgi:hypothetical protein
VTDGINQVFEIHSLSSILGIGIAALKLFLWAYHCGGIIISSGCYDVQQDYDSLYFKAYLV